MHGFFISVNTTYFYYQTGAHYLLRIKKMNLKNMLWLAAILFAIAAIVDFFDNNVLKLAGTICIAVAFALLAIAQNHPRKKMLTSLSYLFLCAAVGVFVYRLLNYYQG